MKSFLYKACFVISITAFLHFYCQVDVAFLRAARAGNLEKVRNFLNEEGDIHTCNAVSNNDLFTNGIMNFECSLV